MASRLYVSNIPSGTDKSELHAFLRGTTTYKSEPIERILYPLNEDDTRACICFYDVPSIKKFNGRNKTFKEKVLVFTESPDIVSSCQVCLSPEWHDFIPKDSLNEIISCHIKDNKSFVLNFDSHAKMNACIEKIERHIIEHLEAEANKSAKQESSERKISISDEDVVEYLFKFKWQELEKIIEEFEVTIIKNEKYIIISPKTPGTLGLLDDAEDAVIDVYRKYSSMSVTENVDLSEWLAPISKQYRKEKLELAEACLTSIDLMLKETNQQYIYSIVGDDRKIEEGKTKLIEELVRDGLGDVADRTSRPIVAQNNEPPKKSIRILLHQQGRLEYTTENPNIKIMIYQGDIINEKTYAIVNAANEELNHGGGLAEAIARAAGDKLVKDCNRIVKEDGPLKVGDAVLSHAGKLNCSKVMHAVGPRKDDCQSNEECFQKLKTTFFNCLLLADTQRVKSMSIPAISSGIFGVPMDIVCEALYQSIIMFCDSRKTSALKKIHLVNIDKETSSRICRHFADKLGISSSFFETKNKDVSCSAVTPEVRRENCINCEEPSTGHIYTCGHQMCQDCIERHSNSNQTSDRRTDRCCRCSVNQPSTGSMIVCHENGYVKLGFLFKDGTQAKGDPQPGTLYSGILKEIYLNEHGNGIRLAKMLTSAFNKRLIFAVCFNKSTEQYHVTWSGLMPTSVSNSGTHTHITHIPDDKVEKSMEFLTKSLDVTGTESSSIIPYTDSKAYHDCIARHVNLPESRI